MKITRLPEAVEGVRRDGGRLVRVQVPIKDTKGDLVGTAIPKVLIVKDGNCLADYYYANEDAEVDLLALIDFNLAKAPLAGFVVEGLSPYGTAFSTPRHKMLLRSVHSGMPVACVGRGNNEASLRPWTASSAAATSRQPKRGCC